MPRFARLLLGVTLLAFASGAMAGELPVNTRLGGDFTLPATTGQNVSLSAFKGKVVLLNFGYTHCPDICPMVLHRLSQVMRKLETDGEQVQPVFVSFDPARDNLEHLKSYLAAFHPRLLGMTGSAGDIAAVAKKYAVIYYLAPGDSAAGPLYTHSDFIYLLDRQGRVRALFNGEQSIDAMVADVRQIIKED